MPLTKGLYSVVMTTNNKLGGVSQLVIMHSTI